MKDKIVINNLLINYYCFKENGAKTLLFLHGWCSNGAIWQTMAEKLNNENYALYALDLPGFGESSLSNDDFTIQKYVDIVSEFIQKKGLKNIILVGHSFGGRIAIKLSATQPDLIEKLVLVDSAGFISGQRNIFKKFLAKLAKPFFKPKFMQGARESIYRMIGAEDYIATPELKQTFINIINEDLSQYLPQIYQPTLIVWGADDSETPIFFAEKMRREIKKSILVVIEKAGHFSFIDQPDIFYSRLKDFINS